MATPKTSEPVDTSAGLAAFALCAQYKTDLEPRLPADTIPNLVADLTTLGSPPPVPGAAPPAAPAGSPPSLSVAMGTLRDLLSATHAAILGTGAKRATRHAYGVSSRALGVEAKALLAAGEKIITQAQANPSEALSLGILPSDVKTLEQAMSDLKAAETAAMGNAGKPGPTAKDRRAAEARLGEAVARIAGAGTLAFATNAAVRATFAALITK
jgi:hypothetical protein